MNAEEITKHLRELFQPDVIELENAEENDVLYSFKKDQYTVFLSGKEDDYFV